MILLDYNPVQYTKAVVTISFILSVEFIFVWQRNLTKYCQRPLKYIVTAIVRCGKWSSIKPHFLSITLLDWTIKQKKQIRNMGYVCVFALSVKCEASHNNNVKVDFFIQ